MTDMKDSISIPSLSVNKIPTPTRPLTFTLNSLLNILDCIYISLASLVKIVSYLFDPIVSSLTEVEDIRFLEVQTSGPSILFVRHRYPRDRHKSGGEAGPYYYGSSKTYRPELARVDSRPTSVPQPPDRPESETALIPHPSSPNTRKRDLQYRIQQHANSPEQRDDEKRVRPDSYLALPAPESDLSDDSMDPRSSSENFPMSDETALAIASSMPLPDDRNDLFLSESYALTSSATDEIATTDGMPRDIMPYGGRDMVPLATRTAIVERTMTTRSMTARSSRPNLLGPSPTPTQEAPVLLTEMSIVTQTQTQRVQSNITPISSPSPLPTLTNDPSRPETIALAAGFPQRDPQYDFQPPFVQLSERQLPDVRLTNEIVSNDPNLPNNHQSAGPIQHLHLPSLAPTADLQMNRELVTTDVEMDSETPETALTLASNFSAQLQSLQSQVDTVSVTSNSLSDRLNLATQTFQS
ncbi:hypothetical protein AC1031_004158 [Aphanomyces cochlioides]|nr:hypothetical protein AC1031_004158 [Aphanomyces cochlioides]